jgi:hypothetical protein
MDILPITEAFRKVTSRDAGSIPVQHSLNEQLIFRRGYPDRTRATGQHVLDPIPRVIPQSIASCWSVSKADRL